MLGHVQSILIAATILLPTSCLKRAANAHVSVSAKMREGGPVPEAQVKIDGELIGETNAYGTFSTKQNLDPETAHTMSITKDDQSYYYSPHAEQFKVSAGGENKITISATMYLVPKPNSRFAAAKSSAHSENPSSSLASAIAAVQTAKPGKLDETFKSPSATITTPLLPLVQIPDEVLPSNKNANLYTDAKPSFFTAHVSSGLAPLGNTEVKWTDHRNIETKCTTNERGRCVIKTADQITQEGSVIVSHAGYQSAQKLIKPQENENLRVNLIPGASADLRFLKSSPWHETPQANVEVKQDGATVGHSDAQGFAVIPLKSSTSDLLVKDPINNRTIMFNSPRSIPQLTSIRFADPNPESLENWMVYDTHAPQTELFETDYTEAKKITETLLRMVKASKALSPPTQHHRLAPKDRALLPLLTKSGKSKTLQLILLNQDGIVSASDVLVLPEISAQKDFANSLESSTRNLLRRTPLAGTVLAKKQNGLVLSVNKHYIQKDDLIIIETPMQKLMAHIASVNGSEIIAELNDPKQHEELEEWKVLGAKVRRQKEDLVASRNNLNLTELMPLNDDLPALRTARKHMAEFNPKAAVTALSESMKNSGISRLRILEERASIYLALGDFDLALRDLYSILKHCLKNGDEFSASLAEININRVRAEQLPELTKDQLLISHLVELSGRTNALESILLRQPAPTPLASEILEYTKLIIMQKKALVEEDTISLATMTDDWNKFEAKLTSVHTETKNLGGLPHAVAVARSKVSLNAALERSPL
jgi:hypothetical protein